MKHYVDAEVSVGFPVAIKFYVFDPFIGISSVRVVKAIYELNYDEAGNCLASIFFYSDHGSWLNLNADSVAPSFIST